MGEATELGWRVQQSPNTYVLPWCYPKRLVVVYHHVRRVSTTDVWFDSGKPFFFSLFSFLFSLLTSISMPSTLKRPKWVVKLCVSNLILILLIVIFTTCFFFFLISFFNI
jgi:hypothetical protein